MTAPFGRTIFCDDIRYELGGKHSLIGVYREALIVEEFPATVAKLALSTIVCLDNGAEPDEIVFRVLKGSEEVAYSTLRRDAEQDEITARVAEIKKSLEPPVPEDEKTQRLSGFTQHFVLSPIHFEEPCRLRVRVSLDGDIVKAGTLLVVDQAWQNALEAEIDKALSEDK